MGKYFPLSISLILMYAPLVLAAVVLLPALLLLVDIDILKSFAREAGYLVTVTNESQQQALENRFSAQVGNTLVASNTNNTIGKESAMLSSPSSSTMNIRPSVQTDFNPNITYPRISEFAYIDPLALVIGDCEIGKVVLVAPFSVCRADEGFPIHMGDYSNMQDGVILHALETISHDKNIDDRRYSGSV
jgi:hypothetical protein